MSTGELDLIQKGSELKNIKRKTRTEENVANDLSNVNHRLEFDLDSCCDQACVGNSSHK